MSDRGSESSPTTPDTEASAPTRRGPRRLGPGLLVTAAFIGPGTVTTASVAGADFGFALVWALVFSIVAAIVLQEMSARLGIVTRQGLGEALRTTFHSRAVTVIVIALVISAIAFGNAAFQTGNLIGAGLGLEALAGGSFQVWAVALGAVAFLLLFSGTYRWIERAVIGLVAVMSVVFIVTAVVVRPDLSELLGGLVPRVPSGATVAVVALIGTTVVPYNLFLHASLVREKWTEHTPVTTALREARSDTYLSIGLGGLITLAIVTTAATVVFARGASIEDTADMAAQMEPLLGPAADAFFAIGLCAAGLTSAITAPLAAAYAASGALGWKPDLTSMRFRAVWAIVLAFGTVLAAIGEDPVAAIVFAQAANGLLLPLIAVFLLVVANRGDLLGEHRNRAGRNAIGVTVVLVAAGLGLFNVLSAFGVVG